MTKEAGSNEFVLDCLHRCGCDRSKHVVAAATPGHQPLGANSLLSRFWPRVYVDVYRRAVASSGDMWCHRGRLKCSPPHNVKSNIRCHEAALCAPPLQYCILCILYISGFVYCPIVKWPHVAPLGPPAEKRVAKFFFFLWNRFQSILPCLVESDWCSQGFVLPLPTGLCLSTVQLFTQSWQVGHNSDQPLIESLLERSERGRNRVELTPKRFSWRRASSQFEPAYHSFCVTLVTMKISQLQLESIGCQVQWYKQLDPKIMNLFNQTPQQYLSFFKPRRVIKSI